MPSDPPHRTHKYPGYDTLTSGSERFRTAIDILFETFRGREALAAKSLNIDPDSLHHMLAGTEAVTAHLTRQVRDRFTSLGILLPPA